MFSILKFLINRTYYKTWYTIYFVALLFIFNHIQESRTSYQHLENIAFQLSQNSQIERKVGTFNILEPTLSSLVRSS